MTIYHHDDLLPSSFTIMTIYYHHHLLDDLIIYRKVCAILRFDSLKRFVVTLIEVTINSSELEGSHG
ncbi:hypothetical protein CEXT_209861 [Caerostris extrusa]|uniref:Uncharacterized protein n=1 Tax=Caerostris extrusa TaxID=172846 RepID=A0AAV4WZF6_CAEEX|nr:hypothetical protein CEXT_209861 [Caerostris extrusa]